MNVNYYLNLYKYCTEGFHKVIEILLAAQLPFAYKCGRGHDDDCWRLVQTKSVRTDEMRKDN